MKVIISPAKKMNLEDGLLWKDYPVFLEQTEVLMKYMQELKFPEAKALWKCNDSIAVAKSSDLCYVYVMGTWKSKNRHKYLLQYHIIFVCKYRKKLLISKQISDDIKQFSYEICQKHHVIIRYMETDKDHIHYMIETEPTMSVSKIVNLMKSYTTYHIWKRYPNYLRKHFWKEHTFWTNGYFVCSVGNVSEEMLKKYIENQG